MTLLSTPSNDIYCVYIYILYLYIVIANSVIAVFEFSVPQRSRTIIIGSNGTLSMLSARVIDFHPSVIKSNHEHVARLP